jgi:hypothetical protein
MPDRNFIDELTRRLGESLPPGLAQAKDDMERRFRTVLTGAFERMNLVSREELDAQLQRLEETEARLEALEARLDRIDPD